MSSQVSKSGVQRILVAVDTSPQSLLALQVAADLASRLDAEVIGLFVEDINLFRLTEMPFIQEVSFYSARSFPLSSQAFERQLRASSRWLREIIEMLSARTNLRWSFQTARGTYPGELLASILDNDLLILVQSGLPGRILTRPVVRSIFQRSPLQALIINQPIRSERQVLILYDGSQSSNKALQAVQLVISGDNPVLILVIAKDYDQALRLQAQAQAEFSASTNRTRYHWLRSTDAVELSLFARREKCDLLVLPAESDSLPVDDLLSLLDRAGCSVLLVH